MKLELKLILGKMVEFLARKDFKGRMIGDISPVMQNGNVVSNYFSAHQHV